MIQARTVNWLDSVGLQNAYLNVCKSSLKQVILSQMKFKLGLMNFQAFSTNLKLHKMNWSVQMIQITRSIDSNLMISIAM